MKYISIATLLILISAGVYYWFFSDTRIDTQNRVSNEIVDDSTAGLKSTMIISGHIQSMEQEMGYSPDKIFNVWFVVDEVSQKEFTFENVSYQETFKQRPLIVVSGLEETSFMQEIYAACEEEIRTGEYCVAANTESGPMTIEISNFAVWQPEESVTHVEPFYADLVRVIK